ncbi:MAG: Methionine-tRNA ligase [Candidatus Magasanikbacteria bacterium GW2011_GWA2_46_17]|uniref:Methionine--tRNA ligase n=1 Tax=Candidatus Magasanikbacteria bacterium GW2011_GWA2_46_17 TaxID=1619042 RepID=A0A0G1P2L4_9BACT|nr:MAG: Methionine-tRNA ligase [Candidatus Magasanikbacteria bacterium GW2011_GWA2_46_17]
MLRSFYITTTIPYVNADPHIGFALEIVQADIVARHKKLQGFDVFFNTGTDEHGVKVYRKAVEQGVTPQAYTDEYADKYKKLLPKLGICEDINFIRTTDKHHVHSAQEFWKKCFEAGDIYKKNYKIKYCVGCELEKTDSELSEGKCAIHPNLEFEIIEEENYFFRLSKYTDKLSKLFESGTFVVPDFRLNEIRSLIKEKGLEDFSVSRLKDKMPWGVPVPNDDKHVMYVWFDAFVNYISATGWPADMEKFNKWWPVVQFAGKDQVRQQAVMWQAMLMSVGIEPSKQIVIHGFITSGGEKMSKSLGNVIDPLAIVSEYGTDALRYYLARHIHPFEDSDFTMERFKEAYNANLANGLGNLTSRVMKMAESNLSEPVSIPENTIPINFTVAMDRYNIQEATDIVWSKISEMDERIQKTEPFKLVKTDRKKAEEIIRELAVGVYTVARMLSPILPETMEKIKKAVETNKMPAEPLFPRKE